MEVKARLNELVLAASRDLTAGWTCGDAQQWRVAVGAARRMRRLHLGRGGIADGHLAVSAACHQAKAAVCILGENHAAGAAAMPRCELEIRLCHAKQRLAAAWLPGDCSRTERLLDKCANQPVANLSTAAES